MAEVRKAHSAQHLVSIERCQRLWAQSVNADLWSALAATARIAIVIAHARVQGRSAATEQILPQAAGTEPVRLSCKYR
jgi:hypothetical protein